MWDKKMITGRCKKLAKKQWLYGGRHKQYKCMEKTVYPLFLLVDHKIILCDGSVNSKRVNSRTCLSKDRQLQYNNQSFYNLNKEMG